MDGINKSVENVPKGTKRVKDCLNKFENINLEIGSLKNEVSKWSEDYLDLSKKFEEYKNKSKKDRVCTNFLILGQSVLILVLIVQAFFRL